VAALQDGMTPGGMVTKLLLDPIQIAFIPLDCRPPEPTILRGSLAIVAPSTQRLPIAPVPKQPLVPTVRLDMIHHRSKGTAFHAMFVVPQVLGPGPPPLGTIPPVFCAASWIPLLAPGVAIDLPLPPAFRTPISCSLKGGATLYANTFRPGWHANTTLCLSLQNVYFRNHA
jgi:hypothetical protein